MLVQDTFKVNRTRPGLTSHSYKQYKGKTMWPKKIFKLIISYCYLILR